jgi:hypothetical protein
MRLWSFCLVLDSGELQTSICKLRISDCLTLLRSDIRPCINRCLLFCLSFPAVTVDRRPAVLIPSDRAINRRGKMRGRNSRHTGHGYTTSVCPGGRRGGDKSTRLIDT